VDASTGAGIWALRPQVTASDLALAADPISSDFVVCGVASSTPALGLAPTATSADDGDIVVARLKGASGAVVWGRQIAASGVQSCDGVAIDKTGHVYLAGTTPVPVSGNSDGGVQAALDFGSGVQLSLPVQKKSARTVWIAKLDLATGNALSAVSFASPQGGAQSVQHIGCDSSGDLLFAGGVQTAALVGSTSITAGTTQSALIAKLNPDLQPDWIQVLTGGGRTLATQIAEEPAGTLMLAGIYTHSLALDGGSIAMGGTNTSSAFVARLDAATGRVVTARGLGTPGSADQWIFGMQASSSGATRGAIWLAGVFTGTLQSGPPAVSISTPSGLTGFLVRLAP
jgi:hypothetical protein